MPANPRKAQELHQRLINFGARITWVAKLIPRTDEGRYLSQKLLRSGFSAAANYASDRAQGAESKSWLEQNRG